jgi:hypothetical protein
LAVELRCCVGAARKHRVSTARFRAEAEGRPRPGPPVRPSGRERPLWTQDRGSPDGSCALNLGRSDTLEPTSKPDFS